MRLRVIGLDGLDLGAACVDLGAKAGMEALDLGAKAGFEVPEAGVRRVALALPGLELELAGLGLEGYWHDPRSTPERSGPLDRGPGA